MAWNDNLTNLNDVLAGLYPLLSDSYRIVDAAGIPKAFVAFQPRAIDNWHAVLDEANNREKVLDVIRVARKDYPENPFLKRAEDGKLLPVRGRILGEELTWNSELPA